MASEILDRADELRTIASKCSTIQEFWKASGFRDVQAAHRANEVLNLNLPIIAKGAKAPPREAQACPKPTSGKGKGKPDA